MTGLQESRYSSDPARPTNLLTSLNLYLITWNSILKYPSAIHMFRAFTLADSPYPSFGPRKFEKQSSPGLLKQSLLLVSITLSVSLSTLRLADSCCSWERCMYLRGSRKSCTVCSILRSCVNKAQFSMNTFIDQNVNYYDVSLYWGQYCT